MTFRPLLAALCLVLATAARGEEASAGSVFPATRDSYPTELNRRPLTLPQGVVEPFAELEVLRISAPGLLGTSLGSSSITAEALSVGLGVGITDRLQLSASTPFMLNPDGQWEKTVVPRLAFLAAHSDDFDVAPAVTVPLQFRSGQNAVNEFFVGFDTRALLNRFVALSFFDNLIEVITRDQLQVAVNFPVTLGLQLARELNLSVGTNLFTLDTRGGGYTQLIFKDAIPFNTRLTFSPGNRVDLYAGLTVPDLKNASDVLVFAGGLRVRL